jgi:uncharacterized membrane protein
MKAEYVTMITIKTVSKLPLTALLVGAGIMHFVKSDFFLKIMPPYFPQPQLLVHISGVCEIVLGLLLLVPQYAHFAAWGIIALLIAVFPANIYLYQHQDIVPASPLVHLLRLPLQGLLILWAYGYTRPAPKAAKER